MHRKLLRRRHVRKLQKTKERERQRKEEKEKEKKIETDRDQKRRFGKKRGLHDKETIPNASSSAKCTLHSMGMVEAANPTASPASIYSADFRGTSKDIVKNTLSNCTSSPTSVLGLQRINISTVTESPEPITNANLHRILSGITPDMGSTTEYFGYQEVESHCRSSFSLPEFSPVRPTKFRKLQL